ncbi:major facilitator superfamily domain-containing protein [Massariosphaeria phaeospora]|uniref:Major facilitator superfamily domain-containing protein n=1 Tax=Massariosphaeria phaeospora TaxID=100035 RepID=A0A7C8MG79_9PLEO|nr:major facilitator superfamily domain-containing protein [Massariosphaeria phaeospora]
MAAGATRRPVKQETASIEKPKKLVPKTTARKLPWLDGGSSPAVLASPPGRTVSISPRGHTASSAKGVESQQSLPSPLSKNDISSSSGSSPTVRRRALKFAPMERRVLSSNPSPMMSDKSGQIRRGSVNQARMSPLREEASPGRSSAHGARRRLSLVPNANQMKEEGDFRPRTESLAPVPSHLERTPSPDSDPSPIPSVGRFTPPVIRTADVLPSQPAPQRTAFERVSHRKLSNAIEGLEDLVEEAVEMAEDTADRKQVEEIYKIIESATDAVQEAATAPTRHLMQTVSPLPLSSSSSDFSSGSESSYASQKPIESYQTQPTNPETRDWAYSDQKDGADLPTTTTEYYADDIKFGTGGPVLQPSRTQTAPREHIEYVLRPAVVRDHSRGRSPQRGPDPGPRRRRHRRSARGDDNSRSRTRNRRHRSPTLGYFDPSVDEEDVRNNSPPRRPGGQELTVRDTVHHHTFSLRRHHRRQPIARNWHVGKKRIAATIACVNTALLGIIVGIYAGEVPRIQYMLADERHHTIIGNVVLYSGLALSTFVSWPLPLLHGRKPYVLAALALALPLQFPQALVVGARRSPNNAMFRTGLLVSRAISGLVLGFANVNYFTTLLDLFGASLQSKNPHQEFVVPSDIRRHGGGMGMWLGIWSWCFIGSLAVGFQIGAGIIESLTPDWGFYIVIMLLAAALVLNVLAPETRRAAFRKSVTEVYDRDEHFITRRVARGEVKLHISTEGPKYWFEEVWAGMKLTVMMLCQPGFLVLALYLGWIYAQIVLVIVLLGALLSRDYKWHPRHIGLGVMSIAIGALLAIPLTKAGVFSRERKHAFRTDSMTFQKQVTWTSHLVRRAVFTLALPLMGLAYTLSSAGRPAPYMVPIVFAGAVGFLSLLAIAECYGLVMETFDTCDLQPGVNTAHRLESMAVQDRRRRTNYSSFPRVSAGIFASQTFAFVGAAVATEVGGIMTRHIGAQASTGVTAGILLALTILLLAVLWRFKQVQVIPNHTFGTRRDTRAWDEFKLLQTQGMGSDWKAVVIGNPSGKMRNMSVLELGGLSRWTEIRKLNFLIRRDEKERKRGWGG